MSTIKQLLVEAAAPPRKKYKVGAVDIYLHGLTIADQVELAKKEDGFDATFWVLERMICDKDGARVFDDDDPALRRFDHKVIDRLADEARKLMAVDKQTKN